MPSWSPDPLHEVVQILLKTCLIAQAMQLPHATPNLFHLFSSTSCASCLGREDTNHIGLEDLMAIWVGNAPFSGWQCSGSTCGSSFHSNLRDLLEKTEALIWILNQFQPHKHPWFPVWLLFNCLTLVICLSALVVWIAQSREDKQTSFLAAWHSDAVVSETKWSAKNSNSSLVFHSVAAWPLAGWVPTLWASLDWAGHWWPCQPWLGQSPLERHRLIFQIACRFDQADDEVAG